MRVSWLGHACFLLETNQGVRVITDPYESGGYGGAVRYDPINLEADIVIVSHQHADHNYTQGFKIAEIIDKKGQTKTNDLEITGIPSYHDNENGKIRGSNIIFIIYVEGLKIVHFGDLGTKDIDLELFKDIDIALIPVGGLFTLDAEQASEILKQIKPKIAIPMHFKTPKLDFDIEGVERFLELNQDYEKKDILEVDLKNINSFKKIILLNYQR